MRWILGFRKSASMRITCCPARVAERASQLAIVLLPSPDSVEVMEMTLHSLSSLSAKSFRFNLIARTASLVISVG